MIEYVSPSGLAHYNEKIKEVIDTKAEVVELTQEEYDNLSDDEKNNGTVYMITDDGTDIVSLSDKVKELEDDLKLNVVSINNEVSSLETDITSLSDKVKTVESNLGGFSFYSNPNVVFLVSNNEVYTDENGVYILSDSATGQTMLADTNVYYSSTIEGNYYSGGADSVSPFKNGDVINGEEIVCSFTARVQMWNAYGSNYGDFTFVITKNISTEEITVNKAGNNLSWTLNVSALSSVTMGAGVEVSNATINIQ